MNDHLVPTKQLFKAIGSQRLFWLESILNQSKANPQCPYLSGSLYLYLFNFRLVDSIKPLIDESTLIRLNNILGCAPTDTTYTDQHYPISHRLPNELAPNDLDQIQSSDNGKKLFLLIIDAFESAYTLVSKESGFFSNAESHNTSLIQYFALRLKLHLNLSEPNDLPVSDKLKGLSEGFLFCALEFHLRRGNDQYLSAKIESLNQTYRLNGHITWLRCLVAKNMNRLETAKGHWLNASSIKYFDNNLCEERSLIFEGTESVPSLNGIRLLKSISLYNKDPSTIQEITSQICCDEDIRTVLTNYKNNKRKHVNQIANAQIISLRQKKQFINLSLNEIPYITPEDFLRTFVFTLPSIDAFKISLALSAVTAETYVFENIAQLISRSIIKLNDSWIESRDLKIVREHAEFLRRIWRNYEFKVYKVPSLERHVTICEDLEYWEFIRQVWPKAKRILIIPKGNIESLINDLNLSDDDDTYFFNLDSSGDLRCLSRLLRINSAQFRKCRNRWPGWSRLFTIG